METIPRNLKTLSSSYFLFGPRGTGKSTWLRHHFLEALWIDLLDPREQRILRAHPEHLIERLMGDPERTVVVIDEIQKVPTLLDVIHRLIEEQRNVRFVLTGSSARKLRRGASNLLAGRLLQAEMHPFLASELGKDFELQQALRFGLIPLIWQAEDPGATLQAYVDLYLREEVQAEALVRDLGAFTRFLEAISFAHGSLLNLSAVARECQIQRKTVEGYLGVLEDLLLCFRIPVFSKRAKRQLIAHEKFYYFDVGVYRVLRPAGPLDQPEEIEGISLEGLVAQHLRAWIAYRNLGERLYFWRTKSGSEVDFVVYGNDCFCAWEVKRSTSAHSVDLRSLKSFRQDYPEAEVALLYLGQQSLEIDGIPVIPCEKFLKTLAIQ